MVCLFVCFLLRNYLKAALEELLWCPTKSAEEELRSDRDTSGRFHPSGLESVLLIPNHLSQYRG